MSNDDRPRRSWSEIDKMRNKSSHRQEAPSGARQERLERSAAYRQYKTQLNKLFDGGALPDALKGKLEEAGVTKAGSAAKKAMADTILAAKDHPSTLEALAAYRAAHGFPDREDVLNRLLELDDEDVVREAIETVGRLKDEGAIERGAVLKARIRAAEMTVDTPEVAAAAKAVLRKL